MKPSPQVLIREYNNAKQMNRDAQKLTKRGWVIVDTKTVPGTTDNTGCGCLLALFGSMRSKHHNKYLVRYEKGGVTH